MGEKSLPIKDFSQLGEIELLALILCADDESAGSPIAQALRLWERFGSLREIEKAGLAELTELTGITPAKAAAIHAALELGRRFVASPLERGEAFTSPQKVFDHFYPLLKGIEQETFYIILLDQQNKLIKYTQITKGSINYCPLPFSEVFAPALREKAVGIILLHNHPSGNPEPSAEDLNLTRRIKKIANELDIKLLDHIIIADNNYTSLQERGIL